MSGLPLIIEGDGASIHDRIQLDRPDIRKALTEHGAVLFRGFEVGGVEGLDQAVRELARKARELLTTRVDELYAVELARYEGAVSTLQVDTDQTDRLAAAAAAVKAAR